MADVYDSSGRKIGHINSGLGCHTYIIGGFVFVLILWGWISGVNPFARNRNSTPLELREPVASFGPTVNLKTKDFKNLKTFTVTYDVKGKLTERTFADVDAIPRDTLKALASLGVNIIYFAVVDGTMKEESSFLIKDAKVEVKEYACPQSKVGEWGFHATGIEMKGKELVIPDKAVMPK